MIVIICSGSLCPRINTKHVEEWNIPDSAEMPIEETRKIRNEIKSRALNLIDDLKHISS